MNKQSFIHIVALGILLLAAVSCAKEKLIDPQPGPAGKALLTASLSRAAGIDQNDPEQYLRGVRMIVVRSAEQGHGGSRLCANIYRPYTTEMKMDTIVPVGNIDLYFIANERAAWGLDGIRTIGELESKIKASVDTYTGNPVVSTTNPIPMYTSYKNVYIDINGNMTVPGTAGVVKPLQVELERIIAKVTLNLSCTFAELEPKLQTTPTVTFLGATVARMPKHSYLLPQAFNPAHSIGGGSGFNSSHIDDLDGATLANGKIKASASFYLPEYLPTDAKKYTYLTIVAEFDRKGKTEIQRYALIVGDGILTMGNKGSATEKSGNVKMKEESEKTNPNLSAFRISRNTHYIFDAQIKSHGLFDGLSLKSGIENWGNGGKTQGIAKKLDFDLYTADDLKIGDYYYSDGTVSDGGLRRRYANGSVKLVDGDKPEPTTGKTVIGIVFQTNPARIGTKEKEVLAAKGVATPHGLVMAINNAGPEVYWCNTPQAEAIPYANTRAACYNDINGLSHTNTIKQKTIADYPAFDKADKYTPAAPTDKSTGWFLPSIGQWWDIMQHLGGAPILATFAEQTGGGQTSPPGQFMWENQDHFVSNLNDWTSTINGSANFSTGQRFWSSTQYNEGAYAARVLEITDAAAGSLEISWYGKKVGQNRHLVRPILAF